MLEEDENENHDGGNESDFSQGDTLTTEQINELRLQAKQKAQAVEKKPVEKIIGKKKPGKVLIEISNDRNASITTDESVRLIPGQKAWVNKDYALTVVNKSLAVLLEI